MSLRVAPAAPAALVAPAIGAAPAGRLHAVQAPAGRLHAVLAAGKLHAEAVKSVDKAVGSKASPHDELLREYVDVGCYGFEDLAVSTGDLAEIERDLDFEDEFHVDEHFDFSTDLEFDEEAFGKAYYHAETDTYLTVEELAEVDLHAALQAATGLKWPNALRRRGSGKTLLEKKQSKQAVADRAARRKQRIEDVKQGFKNRVSDARNWAARQKSNLGKAARGVASKAKALKRTAMLKSYEVVEGENASGPVLIVSNKSGVSFARFSHESDGTQSVVPRVHIGVGDVPSGFMAAVHLEIDPTTDHSPPGPLLVPDSKTTPVASLWRMQDASDGRQLVPTEENEALGDFVLDESMLQDIVNAFSAIKSNFDPAAIDNDIMLSTQR